MSNDSQDFKWTYTHIIFHYYRYLNTLIYPVGRYVNVILFQEFVAATGMPHVYKLKCKLQTYKDLEETISVMPYSFSIPGIELLTG